MRGTALAGRNTIGIEAGVLAAPYGTKGQPCVHVDEAGLPVGLARSLTVTVNRPMWTGAGAPAKSLIVHGMRTVRPPGAQTW